MKLRRAGLVILLVAGMVLALGVSGPTAALPGVQRGSWVSSWATAEQYPRAGFGDSANWSLGGFQNQSIRQVVRISRGGSELRIQLSNAYGDRPLAVVGATIGQARTT